MIVSSSATEARLMMETTLRATSEKLWPEAWSTLGGPRNSSAQKAAKNCSIAARPSGVPRSPRAAARRRRGSGGRVRERMGCWIEGGAQRGEALVAHQHEEAALGQIGGLRRIEARRTVLDSVEPVARDGAAGHKLGGLEPVRAEP